MSPEILELTVAEALRRIEAGELAADEYFDAYAAAANDEGLNAYLWVQSADGARTTNEAADAALCTHR